MAELVAWKLGASSANAKAIATVAGRSEAFPRCVAELREGRLSLDQVGVIAARAADGSDEHYAQLAAVATVNQLRTAIKLEPRPDPDPRPEPQPRSPSPPTRNPAVGGSPFPTTKRPRSTRRCSRIWRVDHRVETRPRQRFLAVGADADHRRRVCASGRGRLGRRSRPPPARAAHHGGGARRCRGARRRPASGSAAVRRRPPYLTCDATCEVWFERDGRPIGAGRTTRTVGRRLRRALEHRHPTCAVPGLRGHPRTARPPHPALGRRRPHRARKPGPALPVSPPGTPPRRHHHHRTRRQSESHRQRRASH